MAQSSASWASSRLSRKGLRPWRVAILRIARSGGGCNGRPRYATVSKMSQKSPRRPTTPEDEGIDLHPDAWARFERTFDKVVKSPPVHRTGKPTDENRPRKVRGRASAKPSR